MRWGAREILPPRCHLRRTHRDPVPVGALLVTEVNAPADVPPLGWLLLTTRAVADAATAWALVHWSGYRWLSERSHSVLSGVAAAVADRRSADAPRSAMYGGLG
ncbi:MAG: hypothetical protein NZ699_04195 [Roseiflexus sp.]|nr:hypothetical protein [Roseiflexus sp.]